jgi:prolyl oligopeptidase
MPHRIDRSVDSHRPIACGRLAISCLLLMIVSPLSVHAQPRATPPRTKMQPVTDVLHGIELVDPYRWLEDQQSPETRAWIEQQNRYTDEVVGNWPGRRQIVARLEELMKVEDVSLPVVRGTRYFFLKRAADQDLSTICLREGRDGDDQVLIDPHTLSPDGSQTVNLLDVSKDGTLLVYGIRQGGEDEISVHLFDVAARKDLPDRLPRARYFGISLTPDKRELFYTRHDDAGSRVFRHKIGGDTAQARQIFGEDYGPGQIVSPSLSYEGRYLIIHVFYGSAAPKSDVYFQDLTTDEPIRPIVNDVEARFSGQAVGDRLFLQTNWDAPNGRILAVDLKNPARDNWQEILPHGEAVLRGFSLVGGRLFVNQLQNVMSQVKVFETDGTHVRDIAFPAMGTVGSVGGHWGQDEAFFSFGSFHIPETIYRAEVSTGDQTEWAKTNVPIESDQFKLSQVWYASKDGTKVPMFLLHKRGIKLDGTNPTLLYGYGGFNISLTPRFSARAAAWVEHGGVFAVANLRGGGEFGEDWHRAGMLENKQNVFDDFHAAAEWLIENKYTQPSKLAIAGGSNGGLLVGAALTQRPELFRAVVCSYPLLDMVRYHQFLVARFWVPEYGSSEDPEQFEVLRKYSPYHNVKPGTSYPAVLFITGDADTRVDPLHARKMAALLQAHASAERPVMLRYDTKLGHSGGRPVSQQIEDLSYELSFLLSQLQVMSDE